MKDYYNHNTKKTVFEVGQRVWVYTLRTRKGLSKKLMHNWLVGNCHQFILSGARSPIKELLFRVTQIV